MFLGKKPAGASLDDAGANTMTNQRSAFTGLVTGVAVWAIWGGDIFPPQQDPTGDPDTWTREEMRRWLSAVWHPAITPQLLPHHYDWQRNLHPQDGRLERAAVGARAGKHETTAELSRKSEHGSGALHVWATGTGSRGSRRWAIAILNRACGAWSALAVRELSALSSMYYYGQFSLGYITSLLLSYWRHSGELQPHPASRPACPKLYYSAETHVRFIVGREGKPAADNALSSLPLLNILLAEGILLRFFFSLPSQAFRLPAPWIFFR